MQMDSHLLQQLPLEIIREVFQYFSTPLILHELRSFPWHLGHICTTWRAIFMSMTSQFWNKLDIDLDVMDNYGDDLKALNRRYEIMLHVLRFFLDRASGHPFSFQLERRFQCLDGEDEHIDSMLRMLVADSTQWEDAVIRFRVSQMPILYRAKNRLPLLRSVQLLSSTNDAPKYQTYDLLDGTSHLTRVNLTHLSDWRIDWSLLRVLKVGQFDYDDQLLPVLSQAKQLEKLAVYQSFSNLDLNPEDEPLTLPSLKVLTIIDFGLLSALRAPALEELYINGWESDAADVVTTSFLTRSSCQLKRFGMAGCSFASLTSVLRRTPQLVHLSLDNDTDMVKSFGGLTFHRQRRDKLPLARHLHSLTIIDPGLHDMELMELSALLASRSKQVRDDAGDVLLEKLQSVSIIMLDQPRRYLQRAAVERLKRQCHSQNIRFSVDAAVDIPWPRHDNTRILDW